MSKPVGKAVDNPFADLEELIVPEPKPLGERLGGASASVDKLCDDSVVKALLRMTPEQRTAFVRDVPEEAIQLIGYSWQDWARKEQLPPPGKWGTWLILAGRGMGKLAALDTEIPTASGWKTFGTVEVGDQLWDERGQPCTVTALHPINETPESYRVTFTGGAVVDCCADHLWTTLTARDIKQLRRLGYRDTYPEAWATERYPVRDCWHNTVGHFGAEVRTTRELRETLTFSTGARVSHNHVVPVARPVVGTAVDLPVAPWTLGYWVGNGTTDTGELTAGSYRGDFDDTYVLDLLLADGFQDVVASERNRGSTRIRSTTLRLRLRALGMAAEGRSKTIPDAYLQASIEQRIALVRGLMDADGYAGDGGVEFCSTSKDVAVRTLGVVNSLGERAWLAEDRARLNGVDYGPRYRVKWRPSVFVPFSIPRKAAHCPPLLRGQARKTRARAILSIEPIPPVPMRCITVDSPSGLFLITRHYVPTHNTRSGAEFIRAKVASGAKRIALVGRTAGDVRDTMIFGESGIMAITPPAERPRYIRADRALIWPNGAQALLATAMEPDILRGPQFEVGWSDELACFPGDTMVLLGDGAQKRIDAVQVGDTVATRSGPRRVGRSVLSGIATELVEALDAEGRVVVRATPNHRVWVAGRGFVPLASVRPMDILVACRSTSGSSTLVNAGTRTGGTGTTGTDPENCSTDGSMQTHTASCSGADTTSTTSTVYAGTTASRISRSSHLLNMPRLTDCAATARGPQRSVDKSSPMRGCGGNSAPSSASCAEWTCVPTECERSSVRDDALRPTSEGGTAYPNTQMAPYATSDGVSRAECSSVPEGPQTPIATVPVSVHGLRVVPANEPVYDIGVEGDHEFFANGILVHNSWFYPETWDNLMMCMRLGANPQVVTTTTPRPTDLIRSLVRDPTVTVTRGSTYDNAGNLPEAYITRMTEKYAGTRLGKQELYAEILDDTSGALWKMTDIPHVHQVPERFVRVITGVDPTVQAQGRSDEVGIVTVGVGESGRLYVLEDASGQMSPALWAEATIRSANRWGAHLIVAEGNQGGDLVRTNIIAAPLLSPDRLGIPGLKQVVIPPIDIVHARVGKVARAEPVVSLYQQRRVVHVGQHAALEDQMTTWIPDVNARSPGRIDALVWAATYVIDLVRSQSAPSRGKVMPFLVPNTPDRGAY